MKWLAVETSSLFFSVAVSDGEKVLACLQKEGLGRPSTLLSDLIEEALKQTGLTLPQVDAFAVSAGPGSFTGLRVGVMTVKTLAWALRKPVLPVSSLEVAAQNIAVSPKDVLVYVDARKGKIYAALFSPDGKGGLRRAGPDALLPPEEPLRRLTRPAAVLGDGLNKYGALLSAAGAAADPVPAELWVPRADSLCRLAARQWPEGKVDDPHRLVPQYLYSQESDITGK